MKDEGLALISERGPSFCFSLSGWYRSARPLFALVSHSPIAAFIAAVRLVFQPLGNRHGGFFKSAETIIEAAKQPGRNCNRKSHLGDELRPVHD